MKKQTVPRKRVVTIDGPAGAGKTTLAKRLAGALDGFAYVDTGAFYRLLAVAVLREWPDLADIADDTRPAAAYLADLHIHGELGARHESGAQAMYLLGRSVADPCLRTVEATAGASILGTDEDVRAIAGELIRAYAGTLDCVVEGRDAGSALFPDADVKFYLWASLEARARRRLLEMQSHPDGDRGATLELLMAGMKERDARDGSRAAAPLRIPEKAIYIDSSRIPADAILGCTASIARHILAPGASPVA